MDKYVLESLLLRYDNYEDSIKNLILEINPEEQELLELKEILDNVKLPDFIANILLNSNRKVTISNIKEQFIEAIDDENYDGEEVVTAVKKCYDIIKIKNTYLALICKSNCGRRSLFGSNFGNLNNGGDILILGKNFNNMMHSNEVVDIRTGEVILRNLNDSKEDKLLYNTEDYLMEFDLNKGTTKKIRGISNLNGVALYYKDNIIMKEGTNLKLIDHDGEVIEKLEKNIPWDNELIGRKGRDIIFSNELNSVSGDVLLYNLRKKSFHKEPIKMNFGSVKIETYVDSLEICEVIDGEENYYNYGKSYENEMRSDAEKDILLYCDKKLMREYIKEGGNITQQFTGEVLLDKENYYFIKSFNDNKFVAVSINDSVFLFENGIKKYLGSVGNAIDACIIEDDIYISTCNRSITLEDGRVEYGLECITNDTKTKYLKEKVLFKEVNKEDYILTDLKGNTVGRFNKDCIATIEDNININDNITTLSKGNVLLVEFNGDDLKNGKITINSSNEKINNSNVIKLKNVTDFAVNKGELVVVSNEEQPFTYKANINMSTLTRISEPYTIMRDSVINECEINNKRFIRNTIVVSKDEANLIVSNGNIYLYDNFHNRTLKVLIQDKDTTIKNVYCLDYIEDDKKIKLKDEKLIKEIEKENIKVVNTKAKKRIKRIEI